MLDLLFEEIFGESAEQQGALSAGECCFFSAFQAGFRKERSVTQQLIRLSQVVCDGFQLRKKMCLVLYDFERAFDRVWSVVEFD